MSRSIYKARGTALKHKQAVDKIGKHMEQKTDADDIEWSPEKQQQDIKHHGVVGVQVVKINATSVRLKHRFSRQMIEIYQHCRDEDQIGFSPLLTKKDKCYKKGKPKV